MAKSEKVDAPRIIVYVDMLKVPAQENGSKCRTVLCVFSNGDAL